MQVPTFDLTCFVKKPIRFASLLKMLGDLSINGFKRPVKCIEVNGRYIVVDGTHRVIAARAGGFDEIPIEVIDPGELYTKSNTFCDLAMLIEELNIKYKQYGELLAKLT